jgi:hypothetical protein
VTGDLCLRATHLFDGYDVIDLAFAKSPQPIVWAVSTSASCWGSPTCRSRSVGSWHQHDTDGVFESCCTVAEGAEDALYVIVRRVVGGVSKRYVERLNSRRFSSLPRMRSLWTAA